MPFLSSDPYNPSISKAIERKRLKSSIDVTDTIDNIQPPHQDSSHRWDRTLYNGPEDIQAIPQVGPLPLYESPRSWLRSPDQYGAYMPAGPPFNPATSPPYSYPYSYPYNNPYSHPYNHPYIPDTGPPDGPPFILATGPPYRIPYIPPIDPTYMWAPRPPPTSPRRTHSRASVTRGRSHTHRSRRRSTTDNSPPPAAPSPSTPRPKSRSHSRSLNRSSIKSDEFDIYTPTRGRTRSKIDSSPPPTAVSSPRPSNSPTDSQGRSPSRGRSYSISSDSFHTCPRPISSSPARRSSQTPSLPSPIATPPRPLSRQRTSSSTQPSSIPSHPNGNATLQDNIYSNQQPERKPPVHSQFSDDHEHLPSNRVNFVSPGSVHQSEEESSAWGSSKHIRLANSDLERQPRDLNRTPSLAEVFGEKSAGLQEYIWVFITDVLPQQVYLHCLLRLPYLYFARVIRIFEQTDLTLGEIEDMTLKAGVEEARIAYRTIKSPYHYPFNGQSTLLPAYFKLKYQWETFVDSLLREWKTLNIISALLISSIMAMFQIQGTASDPITRYLVFWSLICALLSLLYGGLYITRFSSMREPHRAAEWALEARKQQTILWNVWVMLAMPMIWLTWSILLFIACIMCFMWRVRARDADSPTFQVSSTTESALRIFICFILGIGVTYGVLIIRTLRYYGTRLDETWKRRLDSYIAALNPHKPSPQSSPSSTLTPPTRRSPVIPPFISHSPSPPISFAPTPHSVHRFNPSQVFTPPAPHFIPPSYFNPPIPHFIPQVYYYPPTHPSPPTPLSPHFMPLQVVFEVPPSGLDPLHIYSPQEDVLPALSTSNAEEDIEPPRDEAVTSLVEREHQAITSSSHASLYDRPNSRLFLQSTLRHKSFMDSGGSASDSSNVLHSRMSSLDDSQSKDDRNQPIERMQRVETPNVSYSKPASKGTSLKEAALPSTDHDNTIHRMTP